MVQNEEFCITNDGLCILHDEFCVKNDEICIENDEFRKAAGSERNDGGVDLIAHVLTTGCWPSLSPKQEVRRICSKNHGSCSKDDEFCIDNDGFCIKNDGFCIKNDEFRKVLPPEIAGVSQVSRLI